MGPNLVTGLLSKKGKGEETETMQGQSKACTRQGVPATTRRCRSRREPPPAFRNQQPQLGPAWTSLRPHPKPRSQTSGPRIERAYVSAVLNPQLVQTCYASFRKLARTPFCRLLGARVSFKAWGLQNPPSQQRATRNPRAGAAHHTAQGSSPEPIPKGAGCTPTSRGSCTLYVSGWGHRVPAEGLRCQHAERSSRAQ